MAEKNIFVCDACEKSIPFVGTILILQDNGKLLPEGERVWDLCDECEDKIVKFIGSLGGKYENYNTD